jgi:hypothetical protein
MKVAARGELWDWELPGRVEEVISSRGKKDP